jgi:hypothetical protein
MPLKVIGAGLGRTGTLTLKTALEMLGFGPCHHMVEVLAHPEQVPLWNKAYDGEPFDWEEIYAPYQATVDWPGAHFYAQLAERYPDAKVILSKRDAERWYESMSETILEALEGMEIKHAVPEGHPMRFGGIISERTFGFDYGKASVVGAFERHNAEVRSRIAPERLLVFEAAEGWEPLCAFLGVPVPDEPFPRVNDREEFKAHAARAVDIRDANLGPV